MYIVLYTDAGGSTLKAVSRTFKVRTNAEEHAEGRRRTARGSRVWVVYIDDPRTDNPLGVVTNEQGTNNQ